MKFIILLLLVPSVVNASCDISDVLLTIGPKAQWVLRGDQYAGLVWLDKTQVKPTALEVSNAITACKSQEVLTKQTIDQAKIDLNTKAKTDTERIDSIIKYLGLDK